VDKREMGGGRWDVPDNVDILTVGFRIPFREI
jgi:hypothetical protein